MIRTIAKRAGLSSTETLCGFSGMSIEAKAWSEMSSGVSTAKPKTEEITSLSYSAPESDFSGPNANEIAHLTKVAQFGKPARLDALHLSPTLSFSSPESDFSSSTIVEQARRIVRQASAHLGPLHSDFSFSSPESDWCAPTAAEQEASQAASALYADQISFDNLSYATPGSDWVSSTMPLEASHSDEPVNTFMSWASPESDWCAPTLTEQTASKLINDEAVSYSHLSVIASTAAHAPIQAHRPVLTMHEALEPSNEARVLTKAAPEGGFTIVHVNEAWTRLCGYTLQEAHGHTLGMLQGHATDSEAVEDLVSILKQGKGADAILVNQDKHGRLFRNHLSVAPVIQESGEVTHMLGVLRDLGGSPEDMVEEEQRVIGQAA